MAERRTFIPLTWARCLAAVIALTVSVVAAPVWACDVVDPASMDIGSYSSAAIVAGAVPYAQVQGGFTCANSGILTLLSGNYLRATVLSGTVYTLTATGGTSAYKLAAQSSGTPQLVAGGTVYYVNGTTVNLLGTLGAGTVNVPVWFKPQNTPAVPAGTYTAVFKVRWEWYFCPGVGAGNVCVGTPDTGDKTATIKVTMTVAPKPATIAVASNTTWDPVGTTQAPKAIPGSKLRMMLTVNNPDIVALDVNTMVLALPTPTRLAIALDGDGTGSGAVVQLSQGTVPGTAVSTLTLSYVSSTSSTDNVDFSSDGGASWTYAPIAGDAATQTMVTQVRFRPQGSMAPQSSFTISVPYSVK